MSGKNYTSESIRLTMPENISSKESGSHSPGILDPKAAPGLSKPGTKISSFTITSIRPSSRSSNDADTFDEVETDTEDTSDILDSSRVHVEHGQETPSFSEDFSKGEDSVFVPQSLPPANPFNLTTFVHPGMSDVMLTAMLPQGITVDVADGELAYAKHSEGLDDIDNWQKRFKIVKISSKEKFRRGRWVCFDFDDSSTETNKNGVENQHVKETESTPVTVVQGVTMASQGEDGNVMQAAVVLTQTVVPNTATHGVVVDVGIKHAQSVGQAQSQMRGQEVSQPQAGISMNMTTVLSQNLPNMMGQNHPLVISQNLPPVTSIHQQGINTGVTLQEMTATYASQTVPSHVSTPSTGSQMVQQPVTSSNQMMNPNLPCMNPVPTSNINLPHSTASHSVSQQPSPAVQDTIVTSGISQPSYPYQSPATTVITASSVTQPQASRPPNISSFSGPSTQAVNTICMSLAASEQPPLELTSNELNALKTLGATEEGESTSSTSSVAIDNKIEQAMDLVKSHLMFAVREEVEVLKDKIGELMDKINTLECENSVLRQFAPQDAVQNALQNMPIQQAPQPSLPRQTSS